MTERERLAKHYENCIDEVRNTNGITEDFEICLKALKNQPAADVAEVVRCKYCKYSEVIIDQFDNDWYFCTKFANNAEVKADDYCSYGERKVKR